MAIAGPATKLPAAKGRLLIAESAFQELVPTVCRMQLCPACSQGYQLLKEQPLELIERSKIANNMEGSFHIYSAQSV